MLIFKSECKKTAVLFKSCFLCRFYNNTIQKNFLLSKKIKIHLFFKNYCILVCNML